MSTPALMMQPGLPPAVRRVRGYFAPVNRITATPAAFDATTVVSFDPDAPPAPWIDLGWISGLAVRNQAAGSGKRSAGDGSTAGTAKRRGNGKHDV